MPTKLHTGRMLPANLQQADPRLQNCSKQEADCCSGCDAAGGSAACAAGGRALSAAGEGHWGINHDALRNAGEAGGLLLCVGCIDILRPAGWCFDWRTVRGFLGMVERVKGF